MKPFFTILSDPHFGQLNFPSLIQLSLHTLYTYPYIFGTTVIFTLFQLIAVQQLVSSRLQKDIAASGSVFALSVSDLRILSFLGGWHLENLEQFQNVQVINVSSNVDTGNRFSQ